MSESDTKEKKWFRSKIVPLFQCLLTLSTTWLCMALTVYQGKIPPGYTIPTISDGGVYPPEKFIFSIGLVGAAFFMFLFIWIVATADKIYSSPVTAWVLGFPCALGLMILAVCNCQEQPTLHYSGAIMFFFCFAFWCLFTSFSELRLGGLKKTYWVTVRQILTLLLTGFSAAFGIFYYIGYSQSKYWIIDIAALCEWAAVSTTQFFVLTFFFDLGDEYYVEQLKEWFHKPGPAEDKMLYDDEEEEEGHPMLLMVDN